MDGYTPVHIRGPLPADILGTLLKVIGTTYPTARLSTASDGDAFTLLIPDGERPVDPESNAGEALEVLKLDPSGISFSTPKELAAAMTAVMEEAFAEFEPDNYVETEVSVPASEGGWRRYAMIFARSHEQSPHELRQAAEAKLAETEAEIERLRGITEEPSVASIPTQG